MKTKFFVFFFGLLFSFLFSSNTPKLISVSDDLIKRVSDGAIYMKGVINIKFKNDFKPLSTTSLGIDKIDNILIRYNVLKITQPFPLKQDSLKRMIGDEILARMYRVYLSTDSDPAEISQEIFASNNDILDYAEPEFVMKTCFTPNDPNLSNQWFLIKIQAFNAWDVTTGDTNVVIGIVDSGSDLDHPDLASNYKIKWAEYPPNGIDNDNNGKIDDYFGWDFVGANGTPDNNPSITTGNKHGSHVSGCASEMTNNGIGGAGVGYKSKLLITKHCKDNDGLEGMLYNCYDGIVYCYQEGAKIINCSWGGSEYSSQAQQIINNAWNNGCIIVAAAGNNNTSSLYYPACYDNILSVAALDQYDQKASFSNYNSYVDVSAPGVDIWSTYHNNTYSSLQGTSMASPIVAGVAALIKAKNPLFTNTQIVNRLKSTADDIYSLNPNYVNMLGTGRVNAYNAVNPGGGFVALNETFSNTTFPPSGWSLLPSNALWERATVSSYGNGSGSAIYKFFSSPSGTVSQLNTFFFNPVPNNTKLFFDCAYATYQNEIDTLMIWSTTNSGTNWSLIATLKGGAIVGQGMVTAPPTTSYFVPNSNQWVSKNYLLPIGTHLVVFLTRSQYGNNLYIDNVAVAQSNNVKKLNDIIPEEYSISQNYPNPFNSKTKINFSIPKKGFTKISVYDLLGKLVSILISENLNEGKYSVDFDAGNLASGIYFYRIESNSFNHVNKMILIK